MKIYAKIKKSSKYHYQAPKGDLFEVEIDPDSVVGEKAEFDSYCVKGGPGGQYRLEDVNLFMKRRDGVPVRIR